VPIGTAAVFVVSPKTIAARTTDGSPQYYFDDAQQGTYVSELPYSTRSTIETISSGHRRVFRAGGEEVYDSSGGIVSVTDAVGVVTTYSRDAQGRLTLVTRLGRSVGLAYSGNNPQPSQLLGPDQAVLASYGYDGSNRLVTVTYPDATGYLYSY
jgi:YD repeat-containing protein